jgi:3-hydroxyacyl-CoA dehydrogenase
VLKDVKHAHGVVKKNGGASLIDIGDGVLCLEFHSKMNSLGDDQISLIRAGIEETSKNFEAMIVANQGENFSVGANLMLVLLAAQEEEWEELEAAINRFQQATMLIKYAPKPVVSAPFGMTLGGGCEIAIHSARVQASAETYMGLVEVGVGVIPGAGGTKEMLVRFGSAQKAFELIAYAKVATSAAEARSFGLLRPQDQISMNPERLIDDAKALALSIAPELRPRRAAHRCGSGRRGRSGAAEDRHLPGEARQLHLGLRYRSRREAGIRIERRTPDRPSDGLRTIPAGPGKGGFPEPVRPAQDAGAHAAHAEKPLRKAVEELVPNP